MYLIQKINNVYFIALFSTPLSFSLLLSLTLSILDVMHLILQLKFLCIYFLVQYLKVKAGANTNLKSTDEDKLSPLLLASK